MKEARVSKRALVLAVSQDAKKVSQQQVYWNSKCNRNVVFRNNTVLHNIAINGGTYTKSKKLSYTLSEARPSWITSPRTARSSTRRRRSRCPATGASSRT